MENKEDSRQSLNIPILDDRDDEHPSSFHDANVDSPAKPDIVPINLDAANEVVPVVSPIPNRRGRGRPLKQKKKVPGLFSSASKLFAISRDFSAEGTTSNSSYRT
jgi:hypothetical protein